MPVITLLQYQEHIVDIDGNMIILKGEDVNTPLLYKCLLDDKFIIFFLYIDI